MSSDSSNKISRRDVLQRFLFGTGLLGLRALATGLPISLLANPRRALAGGQLPACAANPQYLIFSTSGNGDPVNANVPGTYSDPNISHSLDPTMAPTPLTVGATQTTAAAPWAQLPTNVLSRTCFFHHGTYTVVHPNEHEVLSLMGATTGGEMLVSLIAQQLAPVMQTVQPEPITLGASAAEAVTFQGRPQPLLSPTSLAAILTDPTGAIFNLQKLRDADLNRLNALVRSEGNKYQQAFIDNYSTSQAQARSISQNLVSTLAGIKDNSVASQLTAAVTLIQMNVSPVMTIHIPFGGDNHTDTLLATETLQTVSGVGYIAQLMQQLQAANLQDKVTFAMLNVFGRTLSMTTSQNGRNHQGNHHCSVLIGKGIQGSVIGGVAPGSGDYTALPIDPSTGEGSTSGAIPFNQTLASMALTLGAATGANTGTFTQSISGGQAVAPALTCS